MVLFLQLPLSGCVVKSCTSTKCCLTWAAIASKLSLNSYTDDKYDSKSLDYNNFHESCEHSKVNPLNYKGTLPTTHTPQCNLDNESFKVMDHCDHPLVRGRSYDEGRSHDQCMRGYTTMLNHSLHMWYFQTYSLTAWHSQL